MARLRTRENPQPRNDTHSLNAAFVAKLRIRRKKYTSDSGVLSAAQGRHPQVADTRADIFAVAHTLARVAESRGGFPCVRPHTRRFPPRNPRFTFDADFLSVCDCWTGGEAHSFPYLSIPYIFFYPFLCLVSIPTVFTVKSIACVPAWECLRVWKANDDVSYQA